MNIAFRCRPGLRHRKGLGQGARWQFLFAGQKRDKPLSNMAMDMMLRRMKRDDVTVHGFRSSFRDWAGNVSSFPREVMETALAHVIGDKAEQAYRGPSLYTKLSEHWWMSLAWNMQIAGHVADRPNALDLVNFERHQAEGPLRVSLLRALEAWIASSAKFSRRQSQRPKACGLTVSEKVFALSPTG